MYTWLTRRAQRRQTLEAAAAVAEDRERQAAVRRVLDYATQLQPIITAAPLLTRGQAARSRPPRR